MNIKKIEVNGHYVWVDKDAEIKEGDWYITFTNGSIMGEPRKCEDSSYIFSYCAKIIAASPELNPEGVPTYVEWLGTQRAIERRWDPKSLETRRVANEIIEGVKFGYQAAEKELSESKWNEGYKTAIEVINTLPTWDDVRKAIEMAREGYSSIHTEEEIIEQLKQSKQ